MVAVLTWTGEEDSGLRSLSFNQPLSWRVGRSAIPIADLLERLQKSQYINDAARSPCSDTLILVGKQVPTGKFL
jgi:hypothetical protein